MVHHSPTVGNAGDQLQNQMIMSPHWCQTQSSLLIQNENDLKEPSPKKKVVLGESSLAYLKSAVSKPLNNEKRRAITAKFQLHSCDPVHPSKLDEAVTCLVPKNACNV